jgi:hypothetical protein
VRLAAARVVGDQDDPSVRSTLLDLLESDVGRHRAAAATMLARSETPIPRRMVSALLRDREVEVRREAVDLAAKLPAHDCRALLAPLLEAAPEEADADLLARVVAVYPEVGRAADVPLLLELGHAATSDLVRINVILTLGRLEQRHGTRLALDWYRDLLADEQVSAPVHGAVVTALRQVGDASFLPLLAERLLPCSDDDRLGEQLVVTISVLLGRRIHGDSFARVEPQP